MIDPTTQEPLLDDETARVAGLGYILVKNGVVSKDDEHDASVFSDGVKWARGFFDRLIQNGTLRVTKKASIQCHCGRVIEFRPPKKSIDCECGDYIDVQDIQVEYVK